MIVRILLFLLVAFVFFVILIPVMLRSFLGVDILPGGEGIIGRGAAVPLVRTLDRGGRWDVPIFQRERRSPSPRAVLDLAFHPRDKQVIFAGTRGAGLWRSEDGGAIWRPVRDEAKVLAERSDVYRIAVSPSRPDTMYLAVFQQNRGRVLKSEDAAKTFREIYFVSRDGFGVFDLYTPPSDPQMIMAATGEGGLIESRNGGASWRMVRFFGEPLLLFAVNQVFGNEQYAVTSRGRFYKTSDAGVNWTLTEGSARAGLRADAIQYPYAAPSLFESPGRLFAGRPLPSFALAVNQRNPAALYFISGGDLFYSPDAGSSWSKVTSILVNDAVPLSGVALDPFSEQTLYVTAGQVLYSSSDGGVRWSINSLPAGYRLREIFIHPERTETMFLTTGD